MAISLPRISRIWSGLRVNKVAPFKYDRARLDLAWRTGNQAHQREAAHAFAAATFAHNAKRLAFLEIKGHAVHSIDGAFLCIEPDDKVVDLK